MPTQDDNGVVDTTQHNEGTLTKVRIALLHSGLTTGQTYEAIREMQNAGILFRERHNEQPGRVVVDIRPETLQRLTERIVAEVVATLRGEMP